MKVLYKVFVIVEDQGARDLIAQALDVSEFQTVLAHHAQSDLTQYLDLDFDMVFMDLPQGRLRDDAVFGAFKGRSPSVPFVIVAPGGREQEALGVVQQGALAYALTTDSVERIRVMASLAIDFRRKQGDLIRLNAALRRDITSLEVLGASRHIIAAKAQVERATTSDGNLIMEGEMGTGKRYLARIIHYRSLRQEGPFVESSCNLVPGSQVEAELFGRQAGPTVALPSGGHVRPGRLEQADGGTLYLEEIDKLNPKLQRRLLDFIRTGEVERPGGGSSGRIDVRIIATSTKGLEPEVYSGNFMKDLYEALGSMQISLPPLRIRRDDIPFLFGRFLEESSGRRGAEVPRVYKTTMHRLLEYDWPGNVEELRMIAESFSRQDLSRPIVPSDLPERFREARDVRAGRSTDILMFLSTFDLPDGGIAMSKLVDTLEKALMAKALDRTEGVRNEAARLLGLKRTTFIEKLKKKGLA